MLELGKNHECPFALNARDTTILVYPSGRKPWERLNGSHIRLEQGSVKGLKRPSIYKGCGNRQRRTPFGGFLRLCPIPHFFPEVDPSYISTLSGIIDFLKVFLTIDVRFCSFPQPYISRGTFWGGVRMPVILPPKTDLLLDDADSDASVSIALDTSRKAYDTLPEDRIHE